MRIAFLRAALFNEVVFRPDALWHRPIVVKHARTPLGEVIARLEVHSGHVADDVVDGDFILLWDKDKRVITASDILGRLLRGMAQRKSELDRESQKPSSRASPVNVSHRRENLLVGLIVSLIRGSGVGQLLQTVVERRLRAEEITEY